MAQATKASQTGTDELLAELREMGIGVYATGKVISARAGAQGTTIGDATLRKAAEQAALKAKFNQIGGTTVQTGTITYRYKLN